MIIYLDYEQFLPRGYLQIFTLGRSDIFFHFKLTLFAYLFFLVKRSATNYFWEGGEF